MIAGLGIDLVSCDRLESPLARWGQAYLLRVLTEREVRNLPGESLDPRGRLWRRQKEWIAGRIAVKEATVKALGTGIGRGVTWHDIEVSSAGNVPRVKLSGRAAEQACALGVTRITASITHDAGVAAAVVILQRPD